MLKMKQNNITIKINISDELVEKLLKLVALEQPQTPMGLPMGLLEALQVQPKPEESPPKQRARVGFKIK